MLAETDKPLDLAKAGAEEVITFFLTNNGKDL